MKPPRGSQLLVAALFALFKKYFLAFCLWVSGNHSPVPLVQNQRPVSEMPQLWLYPIAAYTLTAGCACYQGSPSVRFSSRPERWSLWVSDPGTDSNSVRTRCLHLGSKKLPWSLTSCSELRWPSQEVIRPLVATEPGLKQFFLWIWEAYFSLVASASLSLITRFPFSLQLVGPPTLRVF